jgi:hypothetical protein
MVFQLTREMPPISVGRTFVAKQLPKQLPQQLRTTTPLGF